MNNCLSAFFVGQVVGYHRINNFFPPHGLFMMFKLPLIICLGCKNCVL